MGKIKRVKLLTVNYNSVIANGFGAMLGKCKVGKVVGYNKRAVKVSFRDEDGTYTDLFHVTTGTRIDDMGQSSGWRVSPSDWEKEDVAFLPAKSTEKNAKGKTRTERLYREALPMDVEEGSSEIIIEVWKDNELGGVYLRACREITKEGSIRKKQVPTLVPLSVLTKVLEKFNK